MTSNLIGALYLYGTLFAIIGAWLAWPTIKRWIHSYQEDEQDEDYRIW